VLYHRSTARLQVVAGLPAYPAVTREVSLPDSAVATVAVDDSGSAVLVGFSGVSAGSLVLFPDAGPPRIVTSTGPASAVAFLHDRQDIVLVDAGSGEVRLLRNIEFTADSESVLLADGSKGLNQPDSVAIDAGNRRVFVGSRQSNTVWVLPMNPSDHPDDAMQALSCPCVVDGLHAVGRNGVLQISEPSMDPAWVLDGREDEPRILFIPGKAER
jgi:hypothetical protein